MATSGSEKRSAGMGAIAVATSGCRAVRQRGSAFLTNSPPRRMATRSETGTAGPGTGMAVARDRGHRPNVRAGDGTPAPLPRAPARNTALFAPGFRLSAIGSRLSAPGYRLLPPRHCHRVPTHCGIGVLT